MKKTLAAVLVLAVGCGGGGGGGGAAGGLVAGTAGSGPSGPHGLTSLFFLHHSTGEGLVMEGNMRATVAQFNAEHATGMVFWDQGYNSDGLRNAAGQLVGGAYLIPNDNTDPDGLHALWTSSDPGWASARNQIMANHQAIAFKSCFTILPGLNAGTVSQWQNWYLAMRGFFDAHPEKLFIVMTPPPLHRNETNAGEALLAREYAAWMAGPYVAGHANVRCFDLFDRLAHPNDGSAAANMLRVAYESGDSHPNTAGNQAVGPALAQFMLEAAFGY